MQNQSITQTNVTHNIQRLPISTTYNMIQIWLNRFPSTNTIKSYSNNVQEYFSYMCGKKLNELNKEDVEYVSMNGQKEKLMLSHADGYKQHLKTKYGNATVRAKLSAVRSLFEYLSQNGYDVRYNIFDLKFLELKTESYDNIDFSLIDDFARYAREEEYCGEELAVFIKFAAQTSVRVEAVLNVKLRDIKYDSRSQTYLVSVVDKGDKSRVVAIDSEIHSEICELTKGYSKDDKVFKTIKRDWILGKIKKIATKFPQLEGKNICVHSLRHTSPTYEMITTGNIDRVMQQSGHSSVEVCLKTYASSVIDYNDRAGIRMRKKVDESVLDDLSKEELLKLLKENYKATYQDLLLRVSGK